MTRRRVLSARLLGPALALVALAAAGIKAAGYGPFAPRTPRVIAAEFLASAAAAPARPGNAEGGAPLFTDVAPQMGLGFVHDNAANGKYYLPELIGSGGGFLDYDGDGDLDVFLAGGGSLTGSSTQTSRLYRNDGGAFSDVTAAARAAVPGPAFGVACADYDNDGDVDIYVTRLGGNALLSNDGEGGFSEVAARAGVAGSGFGASAAFFDFDRDGWLDLYVTNYVDWTPELESACYSKAGQRDYCNVTVFDVPSQHVLYRNLGNGRFRDVSRAAGIAARKGNGLGVVACDFDGDGWQDLYVANDQTPAFVWQNRRDGTFENVAEIHGAAYNSRGMAIAGMGIACEDFDGDGDFDLLVTNIHNETQLALRNERGFFEDVSAPMGLAWSTAITGFGVALFDQDDDGALDGFIAAGDVNIPENAPNPARPYAQRSRFIRLAGGRFADASENAGLDYLDVARAAVAGDYDNDGDVDLLVTHNGGAPRLLRNNRKPGNTWAGIEARTGNPRRAAIGARLELTAAGRTTVQEVRPQQSYLASADPRVHFGLGKAQRIDKLEIAWPDGSSSSYTDLPVNRYLQIDQEGASIDAANPAKAPR